MRRPTSKKHCIYFFLTLAILLAGVISLRMSNINSSHLSANPNVYHFNLNNIKSTNLTLIDLEKDKILLDAHSSDRIYPASLTKIMTAILTIEYIENLDSSITLPSDIFSQLSVRNASMAGFQPGEKIIVKDLLNGMLLPSGAECCIAAAHFIAGSETSFTVMMNQKAEELGMKNTHFSNTTGLHENTHYSTAEDISILLKYALKNESFRTVFTSNRYSTSTTNIHPNGITLTSTLFDKLDPSQLQYGTIIGGKTGYTSEAGLCLATLADINGESYLLVSAGAPCSNPAEVFHILDAIDIYNQLGSFTK